MRTLRDVAETPRLMEFENSTFYHKDFESHYLKFLTLSDTEGNTLQEYAHLLPSEKHTRNKWGKPDSTVLTIGQMITEILEECQNHGEIYLNLYVNDFFKPNPSLSRKCTFRYRLSIGEGTKLRKGGNKRADRRNINNVSGIVIPLCNLEALESTEGFHSVNQLAILTH